MYPQDNNPYWLIQMPGQPESRIDYATLCMWARSKAIRPDTMVKDPQNGALFSVKQIPGVYSDKEFVTTLLISWFLGVLGVDRFYLGYTGLGIGKLLTFGGCGIWALIDFILIAMRNVPDAQGRPLP